MDAVVTARIPLETKRQATDILEKIGSTPTKLINAAYEYLIATGMLPSATETVAATDAPTEAELEAAWAFVEATTMPMPQSFWDELGDRSYKEYIAEKRWEDYEALT